jgi:inosine-uridine nucleoside N-ribohydrolase
VETVARRVAVELWSGLCRGRTVVDMRRRLAAPEPTAHVAVDVDVDGFRELLLGRLRSLAGAAA